MTVYATLDDAIVACTADIRSVKALELQLADVQAQMAKLRDQESSLQGQIDAANQQLTADLAQARTLA